MTISGLKMQCLNLIRPIVSIMLGTMQTKPDSPDNRTENPRYGIFVHWQRKLWRDKKNWYHVPIPRIQEDTMTKAFLTNSSLTAAAGACLFLASCLSVSDPVASSTNTDKPVAADSLHHVDSLAAYADSVRNDTASVVPGDTVHPHPAQPPHDTTLVPPVITAGTSCATKLGHSPLKTWDFETTDAFSAPGLCGLGTSVSGAEVRSLDDTLSIDMPQGAFEFDFQPASDWDTAGTYMLAGNDGARLLFLYKQGSLYFLKNHSNVHINIAVAQVMRPGTWFHIVGQWGSSGIKLQVNRIDHSPIANSSLDTSAYQPSPRTDTENALQLGGKTFCCMEGISQYSPLSADGTYDNMALYDHAILTEACNTAIGTNPIRSWSFDSLPQATEPGLCGTALAVNPSDTFSLGLTMDTAMAQGAFEFDFEPAASWDPAGTSMLVGNDGARLLFIYNAGHVYFLKNHTNQHINVSVTETLLPGSWYHIAAEWGANGMTLLVKPREATAVVGHSADTSNYEPSPRTDAENALQMGGKTYCCMEGISLSSPLTANGAYDNMALYDHGILGEIQ